MFREPRTSNNNLGYFSHDQLQEYAIKTMVVPSVSSCVSLTRVAFRNILLHPYVTSILPKNKKLWTPGSIHSVYTDANDLRVELCTIPVSKDLGEYVVNINTLSYMEELGTLELKDTPDNLSGKKFELISGYLAERRTSLS